MTDTESIFVVNRYKGLGTMFWVELFVTKEEQEALPLSTLQSQIEEMITSFNDTYSRFREESLLSTLNRTRRIPYDYDLACMLQIGQEEMVRTGGVFDLFIKEKLEQKGYGKAEEDVAQQESNEPSSCVIDDNKEIVLTGTKGVDLGGIRKGYLIDKIKMFLLERHIHYFLINGGGDIYVTSNHEKPITLYLEHPTDEQSYIGTVSLSNASLCVSSSFKRTWKQGAKQVNHFIANNEVWAASYVVAKTATLADIYATVFCIISEDKNKISQLSTLSHLEYLIINKQGEKLASKGFLYNSV